MKRDRGPIDGRLPPETGDERLVLGRKEKIAGCFRVEERLFSEPVAREDERSARRVPHGEREHAVELLDEGFSVALVQMDDDLGVGLRPEAMTGGGELLAELLKVVDLSVEDGPHRSVLAALRL